MFVDPRSVVAQLGLVAGMKAADLGGGVGHFAIPLARVLGSSGKVYVVDIQKDLLGKLADSARKHHLTTIEMIWGDVDEDGGSHLKDESVDLVLLANTMFQLEKKESVAQEAKRILKNKGLLAIVDWSESFGGMGPQPDAVFNEKDARAIFERAGFQYVRTLKTGAHHFGILMRKV